MIVNRNDYYMSGPNTGFGVCMQLFNTSLFDPDEVDSVLELLRLRRAHFGDGVVALDCGANIGVHTVEWARLMTGWGSVVAFEPQQRIFYALAGNIAINNCFNAIAVHAAVGRKSGNIQVPVPDYTKPASFGSIELRQRANAEFIGQTIDYENGPKMVVNLNAIDDLGLQRLDFIKLDVEGMELEALQGGLEAIKAFKPAMLIEHIKSEPGTLEPLLEALGYRCFKTLMNILAVHQDDPCLASMGAG
jgi:FkbM family methyltransferase